MIGKKIKYKGVYYKITLWDAGKAQASTEPPDSDLTRLLRQVMLTNRGFVYYPEDDSYSFVHHNLNMPAPITDVSNPPADAVQVYHWTTDRWALYAKSKMPATVA